MIRLIELILSDGSTVWNIEYDGVEKSFAGSLTCNMRIGNHEHVV